MWVKTDYGPTHRFYTLNPPRIPEKGYFSTWGYEGTPEVEREPDEWNFHVIFTANGTADVILTWNNNESILFERNSANLNETFVVALPRTSEPWRWDWLIRNPKVSTLIIENFTVIHYSITYSERQRGLIALSTGIAVVLFAVAGLVYLRRGGSPLK